MDRKAAFSKQDVHPVATRMARQRRTPFLLAACVMLTPFAAAGAQSSPPQVVEVVIEEEGRVVVDPQIRSLIETATGRPLAIRDVRESISHLTTLGRFDDVRVMREDTSAGIRLRYVLVPSHPVDRLEFRGALGVKEDELRRAVRDRFGVAVPGGRRADEVAMTLRSTY